MAKTAPPPTVSETTVLTYLQQALDDLDRAREKAGEEARERIDAAGERIRTTVRDLRRRVEQAADDWERTLDRADDEIRRELAIRAIHAQQSPAALTALSREIRKRRAEITAHDA